MNGNVDQKERESEQTEGTSEPAPGKLRLLRKNKEKVYPTGGDMDMGY